MKQRFSSWIVVTSVTTVLVLIAVFLGGDWRLAGLTAQEAKDSKKTREEGNPAAKVIVTPSRVAAVTVFPSSAIVTREADVPAGKGVVEVTISPLPAQAILSSLNAEGTEGIRVLSTRFRSRMEVQDTRADIGKLQTELIQLSIAREKIDADVKAYQENLKTLSKMEGFMGVSVIQATEKGALNAEAAITLAKYVRDSRLETSRELVKLEQEVKANQGKAAILQARMNELATATTRTERDAVILVDRGNGAAASKVRLNYLVDHASWRPQYKLRAGKTAKEAVQIEFLAAVFQNSGEDWADVNLVLSTAQPMLNASPPDLQALNVAAVHKSSVGARSTNVAALEEQVCNLRNKAQKDINEKKASGVSLFNSAAALDQAFELHNSDAAIQRGCAPANREGPTVTYSVSNPLSVASRPQDQVIEVARAELTPDYYYKSVPLITTHVYRLADFVNKSDHVILPGDATIYIGTEFVGQMALPLVAVNEPFTVGFGVDPQMQVTRQIVNRQHSIQGGNQTLHFEYRTRVNSYKNEKVKLQVWDRLPRPETDAIVINILKSTPELSKDPSYLRGPRTQNILRWDVAVEPNATGEKALTIQYEFKMEMALDMTISDLRSNFGNSTAQLEPPATPAEQAKINAAMAKLNPNDQKMAQAQEFCAIKQSVRLGTVGSTIHKAELGKGQQPVFFCCPSCANEGRTHPDETLVKVQNLMSRMGK